VTPAERGDGGVAFNADRSDRRAGRGTRRAARIIREKLAFRPPTAMPVSKVLARLRQSS